MVFTTKIDIILDFEYYDADFLTTIDPDYLQSLSFTQRDKIVKENKASIKKTDKSITLQNEICKLDPNYIIGKLLSLFDKDNIYDMNIYSIKWKNKVKSSCLKDTKCPTIDIVLHSTIKINKDDLFNYMYYTNYMQEFKYNVSINNGWSWYSIDKRCEYARTRMIDIIIS